MAVLDNITVVDADLISVRADITQYFLHSTDDDFTEEIAGAKRKVYREIRAIERVKNPALTEEDLATLLDTINDSPQDKPILEKIVYITISDILIANNMTELAEVYFKQANEVALSYLIDTVQEDAIQYKPIVIGR